MPQAIAQRHAGVVVGGADRMHACAIEEIQSGHVAHRLPRRLANTLVGHQHAQFGLACQRGIDAHVVQAVAFHHPRGAQGRRGVVGQVLPDAEIAQLPDRGVREGDLASVEGGFGDCGTRLTLHQRHLQVEVAQRLGQAQAGRAGADDDDVVMHAHAFCCGGSGQSRQARANGIDVDQSRRGCPSAAQAVVQGQPFQCVALGGQAGARKGACIDSRPGATARPGRTGLR